MIINKRNLPIFLTLFRLVFSPIIIPLSFSYAQAWGYGSFYLLPVLSFILFTCTDFLDGFIARRWGHVSRVGALIDPLADKFLLYSTLIVLLFYHMISLFVVSILLGREFFMLGLRHIAAEFGISIKVSSWGKYKTAFQSFYIILCMVPLDILKQLPYEHALMKIFMVIAIGFSLGSALQYSWVFINNIKKER